MKPSTPFHCLPKTEAGAPMPTGKTILAYDSERKLEAAMGSAALLAAYNLYFESLGRARRGQ